MEKITVTTLSQNNTRPKRVKVVSDTREHTAELGWNYDYEGADMARHAIVTAYGPLDESKLRHLSSNGRGWTFGLDS